MRDNPAAARAVKTYLKDITNEQLMDGGIGPGAGYPGVLGKVKGGSAGNIGGAGGCEWCASLLASSDEGDALSGDGLPPTRKAVGRDENRID